MGLRLGNTNKYKCTNNKPSFKSSVEKMSAEFNCDNSLFQEGAHFRSPPGSNLKCEPQYYIDKGRWRNKQIYIYMLPL